MKTDRWPNLLTQFLVATTLLTRLPLPRLREDAFALGARSAWAYPLAGLIVGSLAAGCAFGLLSLSLPAVAVAGVLLGIMMITTGAMHEDGLADVFDGFWGGYTPERRLDIMKDSQIGSFGVLALLINTGLRWSAYAAVLQISLAAVLVVATQSRATMPWTMAALPNARQAGLSQSVGRPSMPIAYAAFAIGGATGIALLGWTGVATLASVAVITGLVAWIAQWKIGGQTGDVLGATQQLSETAALLTLLILM